MLTNEYISDEIFDYFGYGAIEVDEITRDTVKNFIIRRALNTISPYANRMQEHYFKITEDDTYYYAIVRYKDRTSVYQKVTVVVTTTNINMLNRTLDIVDTGTAYSVTYNDATAVTIPTLDTTNLLTVLTDVDTVVRVTSEATDTLLVQTGLFFGNNIFALPDDVLGIKEVVRALANEYLDDIVYRSAWNKIIEMSYQGTGGITNWQLTLQYLEEVRENFTEFNQGYERVAYPDIGKHGLKLYPSPQIGDWVYIRYSASVIHVEDIPLFMENWFIRYCIALAKERIGRVRSKFSSLPGPAGGIALDGNQLLSEAQQEIPMLMDELLQLDPLGSFFVI